MVCVCVVYCVLCTCAHAYVCVRACVHASDFGETKIDCETMLHKKVFMGASQNGRLYWLYNM